LSEYVTRRRGERRGPGLNRFSEKASLGSYSLTSSLQLVRIGPLQLSSAACTILPKLMAPRNHSTAEPGVGSSDSLAVWTHARASWINSGLGLMLGIGLLRKKCRPRAHHDPHTSVDSRSLSGRVLQPMAGRSLTRVAFP